MKLSDFNYNLPEELVAQRPLKERDASRLLVLHRKGGKIEHCMFRDLPGFLNKADLLVLNDTKVFKARLCGKREGFDGKIEILLTERLKGKEEIYAVLAKPSRKLKEGTVVIFGDGRLRSKVIGRDGDHILMHFSADKDLEALVEEIGTPPLPPYIKRDAEKQDDERYQTVFAKSPGAIAAPTAGLHFTAGLLEEIGKKGVDTAHITLHVGYGTFKPVAEEDITKHKMHKEYYEITAGAADKINRCRGKVGRVVACGTTSCRALESAAYSLNVKSEIRNPKFETNPKFEIRNMKSETDLFIYPGFDFKITDALITNFHLPKSTLLMLVSAFAGRENIFKAYEEAKKMKYRFFSYGDAMLII